MWAPGPEYVPRDHILRKIVRYTREARLVAFVPLSTGSMAVAYNGGMRMVYTDTPLVGVSPWMLLPIERYDVWRPMAVPPFRYTIYQLAVHVEELLRVGVATLDPVLKTITPVLPESHPLFHQLNVWLAKTPHEDQSLVERIRSLNESSVLCGVFRPPVKCIRGDGTVETTISAVEHVARGRANIRLF